MSESEEQVETVLTSLVRIQDFETNRLVQHERLGEHAFHEAVRPASVLVSLFKQVPKNALSNFAPNELNTIRSQADNVYAIFEEILNFDLNVGDNKNRQGALIEKLQSQHQGVFTKLMPIVAYCVARTVDFNERDAEARSILQAIKDQTSSALNEIQKTKSSADEALEGIKKAAAESGVSKQAFFFEENAKAHKAQADSWQKWTVKIAIATGCYGLLTLFFHKIPWFQASSTFELVQITTAKVVLFFVLVFVLLMFSRNYRSHRHNQIVSEHRQNALLTYKALAEASAVEGARDIILAQAAEAIYSFQDSGYVRSSTTHSGPSIIDAIPRASISAPISPGQ